MFCVSGGASMSNSIVAFSSDGEGVAASDGNAPALMCCNVYGNASGEYDASVGDQTGTNHNLSEDPEFCNAGGGDYTLYDTSPCLSPVDCGEQLGAFGEGCNNPVEEVSWGSVKSLWN